MLHVDVEDLSHKDEREDDAENGNRIGAGIADSDVALIAHGCKCFLRRAETGRARDGAEVNAHELRQRKHAARHGPDADREQQAQHHRQAHEAVQAPAAVSQGREKRRANLQADEEDKEDEAEVSEEGNDRRIDVDAEIARKKTQKQHAGDADRDAEELEASDPKARRDDERICEKRMREGARVGE